MLPTHGRYRHSSIVSRPDYTWPGGRRLAVYIAVNVEAFLGYGVGKDFWTMDNQPIWLTTRAGRILSMPYPIEVNERAGSSGTTTARPSSPI